MKTLLKVLLIAALVLAVAHFFPFFLIPVALAGAALFVGSLILAGGAGVAIIVALALIVALLALAVGLAAALAPIWLPLLLVLGIVALIRRVARTA